VAEASAERGGLIWRSNWSALADRIVLAQRKCRVSLRSKTRTSAVAKGTAFFSRNSCQRRFACRARRDVSHPACAQGLRSAMPCEDCPRASSSRQRIGARTNAPPTRRGARKPLQPVPTAGAHAILAMEMANVNSVPSWRATRHAGRLIFQSHRRIASLKISLPRGQLGHHPLRTLVASESLRRTE